MERIEARLVELNAKLMQLKEEELVPKQNIEQLKSQQYLEDMKLIPIAQAIEEINKEIKDLNIAKSVLQRMDEK